MIDVEGDSVMSPVAAQFHDDARVKKTAAAGAWRRNSSRWE